MSKIKQQMQTYAMNVSLILRDAIKANGYEIEETNYEYDGLRMLISETHEIGKMHYEIKIIPQPFINPDRKVED